MGQLIIPKLDHSVLYIAECSVQLAPDADPVAVIGIRYDRVSPAEHGFLDANGAGQLQDISSDRFNSFLVGCLNCHKALGNNRAQHKSNLRSGSATGDIRRSHFTPPIRRTELIQYVE